MPLSLKQQQQPVDDASIIHNLPIGEVMKRKLETCSALKWESDQENAFFVADLGEVYRQHLRWKSLLPRIEPFFGMSQISAPLIIILIIILLQPSNQTPIPWL